MKKEFCLLLALCMACVFVAGCKSLPAEDAAAAPSDVVVKESEADLQSVPEQEGKEEKEPPVKRDVSPLVTYGQTFPELVLPKAELAFKGTVLKSDGGIMTNPEGKNTDANGYRYPNQYVTTYTVKIGEVFKGNYGEETIEVKISNGYGLSPELILYGETETEVWSARNAECLFLEEGDEAYFLVNYKTMTPEQISGYYIYGKEHGCQVKQADGHYRGKHSQFEWTDELLRSLSKQ